MGDSQSQNGGATKNSIVAVGLWCFENQRANSGRIRSTTAITLVLANPSSARSYHEARLMKHVFHVAAMAAYSAWSPNNLTLRELLWIVHDAFALCDKVRTLVRWVLRVLTVWG